MNAHALEKHPLCREFRRLQGSQRIVWHLCGAHVLYVADKMGGDMGGDMCSAVDIMGFLPGAPKERARLARLL